MTNFIYVVLLIIGFILLVKGADVFVDGASSIAKKMGIPSVIVGLTIVSLGTSAPELAVSSISAFQGNNGIAIGNVLGSNIFNTLVVLGGTAIASTLVIKKNIIKRDFFINIIVIILLYFFCFGFSISGKDGLITRSEGIILIVFAVIYILFLIISAKKGKTNTNDLAISNDIKTLPNIIKVIIGILAIVIGGKVVVDSATQIAYSIGMSEKLVGLTIVAVGTSLPELVTSIVAAFKGETEIAIGNVLGSNIFNILLILGLSSTINPIVASGNLYIDLIFLMVVTIIIGVMIFFNKKEKIKKLNRLEGTILVLLYVGYLSYIIMRN